MWENIRQSLKFIDMFIFFTFFLWGGGSGNGPWCIKLIDTLLEICWPKQKSNQKYYLLLPLISFKRTILEFFIRKFFGEDVGCGYIPTLTFLYCKINSRISVSSTLWDWIIHLKIPQIKIMLNHRETEFWERSSLVNEDSKNMT